jgi:uncharacterized membrane protein
MLIANISVFGWLHSLACIVALVAGTYVMVARKGTRRHRLLGWWYAGAMAVQAVTIMVVYRFDFIPGHKPAAHTFGIFHWMAVASFLLVALSIFAAMRQRKGRAWAHVHAQAMLASVYLLVGGLINEMVVRVLPLRDLAMALSPHATNPAATLLTRCIQSAFFMAWLALHLWFVIKVNRDRRPRPVTVGYPMRYSGGLFVAIVGAGILIGAITGMMGYGLLGGFILGFVAARRSSAWVAPYWGRPSTAQMRMMILAIGMEATLFAVIGTSGFFAHADRTVTWEITLAIVGFHFLVMRFSHGKMMLVLAAAVLGWIALGGLVLHLPVQMLAAGDGAIKIAIGGWMAWPLLRVIIGRSAPGYPQASGPAPAAIAE